MADAKIVDAYEIRIEERGEFRYVYLHFQCADGSVDTYEFVPPYAHKLSDELCRASAMAVQPKMTLSEADGS